ncbi:MAG: Xaa-Pro peptidase family protein [Actinobacteria bacterium]|nr:Xaa-Pro peptidase family protein [Actinomycetota bacterium]
MPNVVIVADTVRSPELRHEVPVPVLDPLIYVETEQTRTVYSASNEIPRLEDIEGLEIVPLEEIGLDELRKAGLAWAELELELALRACRHAGVSDAAAPRAFPLAVADHLRANGVEVRAEGELFDLRRRSKTAAEIEGIRRAQRACEEAMDRAREVLRGEDATSERLHAVVNRVFTDAGLVSADSVIASHGAQTAVGHEPGHGPIERGEPVVVDIYPQDPVSGCYSDMTRTFCVGDVPDELSEYHRLVREALDRVYPEIRPGVTGAHLWGLACDVFEEHGYPTQRTKTEGEVLAEGFNHSLGHGVGLEVHELPSLGMNGGELVVGDVVTVEPGLYRPGFGGCRLEDIILVTDDGCEVLTDYPYDLEP